MSSFLAGPYPRAFAHRGWHVGELAGLENTRAAFAQAVAEGYRYLETDVHLTADGRLVAFHDRSLDRVTDRTGAIELLSWDEISRARISGRESIPLLSDLLTAFPETRFNIDAKSDRTVGPLARLLAEHEALDRVCLASFADRRLHALRLALGPSVAMSLGPRQVVRLVARAHRLPTWIGAAGAVAAQVPVSSGRIRVVTAGFVRTAHRFGIEVHVWTVDDAARMTELLDLGVDGLITDRPDVLRDVLRDRDAWTTG